MAEPGRHPRGRAATRQRTVERRGASTARRCATEPRRRRGAVVITGICGRLGKGVARVLHRERRRRRRRPSPVPRQAQGHRAPPDRRSRKKLKDVFRSRATVQARRPPRRHARPARVGRGAPLVERRRLRQAARVRRAVLGAEARRPLERERLRAAARQPAVPRPRRRRCSAGRASARSATSSRSTCSPRASSGSTRRPRPSSSGRCTSSAACATPPRTTCASTTVPTRLGFDPMVQVIHEERRRARHPARAAPGRARHLQRRRPRAAAALAHHQAPRAAAPIRPATRWRR